MRLQDFCRWLGERATLSPILGQKSAGERWYDVCPEARPPLVAAAWQMSPGPCLVVTKNYDRALHWVARLALCGVPADAIRLLPSGQSALFENAAPETTALSDRIGALRALSGETPTIVVATAASALERTLPLEVLDEHYVQLYAGQTLDIDDTVDRLSKLGYEISDPIRVPGQFSRRGGILDVFPMGAERPVRVELFGDEVETLRFFDPMSQRSVGSSPPLKVLPARETILPLPGSGVVELLQSTLESEANRLPPAAGDQLRETVAHDLRSLEAMRHFDRLDLYRPFIQPDSGCAVDLLGEKGWLVLEEPFELAALANRAEEELGQALAARAAAGEFLEVHAHDYMLPPERFGQHGPATMLTASDAAPNWFPRGEGHELGFQSLEPYRSNPTILTATIQNWLTGQLAVGVSTDQPTRAKAVLAQAELFPTESETPEPAALRLLEGNLAGGFVAPAHGAALLTDHELFGVGRLKLPQRRFSEGVPITTVLDLKPGDFVVHINYGIGIYRGLVKRVQEGTEREFLHIDYQTPDRLFVPADQLDRVQKYLAPDDVTPKINRLTGGDWQRTVGKAREEAREFARELIRLYAERRKTTRPSYGSDSPWQAELEHTFPWVETPSQLAAIIDVKEDLETEYPMDRLICGDVGFGKTEVAIRAAFKVVQAGSQVAVLCPTTILSEQHYRSFCERLSGFPTRVGCLTRFTKAAARKALRQDLERGDLDIVIGTHALLNDKLAFKKLGLIIVDEEQKFGVKHKEALKTLRTQADVLTLSATPIPRTLSMSLMSIRPMSLINDPPPGRLPIRTYVRPFSTEVVREALLRELTRGGQVYYVFNRVSGIYHVAERLKKLVPTAKIAVGHGQMTEAELEPVMLGFINGEIDILVSTTIVENGLDIPSANTLIVENADKFGLSQLYQLRGRVGRSDVQAYSYFLYSADTVLTENATARLGALQEFNHLGSGYSLAFRDLQIRGAGDLLGAKQSGQMSAVGFDLYSQLIDSEVHFLKSFADGTEPQDMKDPLVGLAPLPILELPVKALIPTVYVPDEGQRLYYYKLLMSSREVGTLMDVRDEIRDRYGALPVTVEMITEVMRLRIRCAELGLQKVEGKDGRLAALFEPRSAFSPRAFSIIRQRYKSAYMSGEKLIWPFEGDPIKATERLLEAIQFAYESIEAQRASLGVASSSA
ncbi:MAG: transcription-repair coupling factor [Fimbriimonadaceae bacterium]|nr:transcription-repair coupling factor [Fimbriimonadaceae bacterium]QYK57141.1 MAG: transcription-repair coupling factor [Fimbriimonadaceae bacterium]